MSNEFRAATTFWDQEVDRHSHCDWMAQPRVRRYINELISGPSAAWPMEWFEAFTEGRRFHRGLSVGCGTGELERAVIRQGLCAYVDAFDGSLASLQVASSEAEKEGFSDRIRYFAADFNQPALPSRVYDIVFIHQSLHHVGKLEKLLRSVLRALLPEGLLYLDEYIGPSRTDWNDELIAPYRQIYETLPKDARTSADVPLPIQADDPSEAVRSSEIVCQVGVGFDIKARRDYGGSVLAVLYPLIDWVKADVTVLEDLIENDRRATKRGESYHAVIIAAPKTGWGRVGGEVRYFLQPKLRRLRYEILYRLGRRPRF